MPNTYMNGNIPEPLMCYPSRDHPQISPAGSMSSGGPAPVGMLHVGTHSNSSHGSHQNLQHAGYPLRPDQNQNVKNGVVPPAVHVPMNATAQAASTKHQEQRLTHEQVNITIQLYLLQKNVIKLLGIYINAILGKRAP